MLSERMCAEGTRPILCDKQRLQYQACESAADQCTGKCQRRTLSTADMLQEYCEDFEEVRALPSCLQNPAISGQRLMHAACRCGRGVSRT